jgi:uncharacterized membrane protein YjjB (DUF3815 family)
MPERDAVDMRSVWQSESEEIPMISVAELQKKADRLNALVRWRNIGEYSAAALIVAANLYYFFQFENPLLRIGSILIAAGVLYAVVQLHRKGSSKRLTSAIAGSCLDFLSNELRRQRDLQRTVWTWYLLPLLPGLTIFILGLESMRTPSHSPLLPESTILHTTVACVIAFALIAFANNLTSRRLQRKIDAIESLKGTFSAPSRDEQGTESQS